MSKASSFILRLYFAVVAAVTLFTLMFGAIDLLQIGLRTVIPGADQPEYIESCTLMTRAPSEEKTDAEITADCEARKQDQIENYKAGKARDAVDDLALIIIALPLFIIHFRIIFRDWQEMKKEKIIT